MASTYTTNLRLTLPTDGELPGTWGSTVNTGVTALLETAISGRGSVAMTDADYTLTTANGSADEARNMVVRMTGALTANRNVICPTAAKLYILENATTGGFALTLKTAAGSGISVANGSVAFLRCDATNVVNAFTALPTVFTGVVPLANGGLGASHADVAAVRATIGSTTVGDAVFIAADTAAGRSALGSTTVGDAVFIAASQAAAHAAAGIVDAVNQSILTYVSASSLRLDRLNGDRLTVNGVVCTIPSAGVTLAAAPAAANTNYYIYAVATAGVITSIEASTTAYVADTTAGNAGNRIKSGDATRTWVGLARGNNSTQWADTTLQRFVRSPNDKGVIGSAVLASNTGVGFAPWGEVSSAIRLEYLSLAGESVLGNGSCACYEGVSGTPTFFAGIGLDGTAAATGRAGIGVVKTVGVYETLAFGAVYSPSEGYHYHALIGGQTSGNSPNYLGSYCGHEYRTSGMR